MLAQDRPRLFFFQVFETFLSKICAHSERYIYLLAGLFLNCNFLWRHRVSIVTGLRDLIFFLQIGCEKNMEREQMLP